MLDCPHLNINCIIDQLDYIGINNYNHLKKILITNTDLVLDNFEKIHSISEIDRSLIQQCLFFLHFITDDEYFYHLDKIIEYGGKFIIQKDYNKKNYVHSNKTCRLALLNTIRCIDEISHFGEIVHGNICQALEQTKCIEGDYVEIGVYKGGSALTAFNYMKHASIKRKSYLLDTFDGFDYEEALQSSETHWEKNNNHHKLFGVESTMKYINTILTRECPEQEFTLVQSNICINSLPESIQKIAVANIDVDIYDATRDAIQKVGEKMVTGGIMICEDPTSTPGLIGAFYAMEKFLKTPLGKKFMKLHLTGQYFLIKMED
jgi:hypothetical protein